jgi:hypothetical protein
MTDLDPRAVMDGFSEVVTKQDWDNLERWIHPAAVWEYPQSGEVFRGLANIRAQFEQYPGPGAGTSELREIVGGREYALTPAYTLIALEGSGNRGTAVVRVRYPDGGLWWVLNLYELRDERIGHARVYFAPDFDAPDWRAPFRDPELSANVEP